MPTLEAHVETPRAARYVEQLTWSTRATQDKLILHVEAEDPDHLRDLTTHVAERIEQIGRRDNLQVHWQDQA